MEEGRRPSVAVVALSASKNTNKGSATTSTAPEEICDDFKAGFARVELAKKVPERLKKIRKKYKKNLAKVKKNVPSGKTMTSEEQLRFNLLNIMINDIDSVRKLFLENQLSSSSESEGDKEELRPASILAPCPSPDVAALPWIKGFELECLKGLAVSHEDFNREQEELRQMAMLEQLIPAFEEMNVPYPKDVPKSSPDVAPPPMDEDLKTAEDYQALVASADTLSNTEQELNRMTQLVVDLKGVNVPLSSDVPKHSPDIETPSLEEEVGKFPQKWSNMLVRESDNQIANRFYAYLKTTESFYTGEIHRMKKRKSPIMNIYYSHMEDYDFDSLAIKICENYSRLESFLKERARKFLKEVDLAVPDRICQSLELRIIGMPKSHNKLADILKVQLIKAIHVYSMVDPVLTPTEIGCRLLRAAFAFIFSCQKAGMCWGGNFDLDDIEVKDNMEFIIRKPPGICSPKGSSQDLIKIFMIFLPYFCKGKKQPPYFSQLEYFLREMPTSAWEDPTILKKYRKYILNHMTIVPSFRRAALISGIHKTNRMFNDNLKLQNEFQAFMNTSEPKALWLTKVLENSYLSEVLNHRGHASLYNRTYASMVTFLRHFYEHGLDNSKLKPVKPPQKLNSDGIDCSGANTETLGIQQANQLDEFELTAAINLDKYIADMIWVLIVHGHMDKILESLWNACKVQDDLED